MTTAAPAREVGGRLLALVVATGAVAALHAAGAPLPGCPLRAATGLPCPACGATTAGLALAGLDLPAAVAASPAALLGAGALVTLPLWRGWWQSRRWPTSARAAAVVVLVTAAELWQLARLDLL